MQSIIPVATPDKYTQAYGRIVPIAYLASSHASILLDGQPARAALRSTASSRALNSHLGEPAICHGTISRGRNTKSEMDILNDMYHVTALVIPIESTISSPQSCGNRTTSKPHILRVTPKNGLSNQSWQKRNIFTSVTGLFRNHGLTRVLGSARRMPQLVKHGMDKLLIVIKERSGLVSTATTSGAGEKSVDPKLLHES